MKKRFLSIVLAVLMLVSVLPVTAMAADGPTDTGAEGTQTAVGTVSTDGAIHVNKSVSADGKTLELEAFATNTVSTETTYDPLDIVLVLDVSGSMGDNNITSYKYTETTKKEWSCDDIYNSSVYYYYMDGEGYYRRVSWDDEGGIFRPYRCWITAGGTRIGNKVPNWNDVSYRGKLYTRTNEGTVTRMQALKTAVNKFIDNVATQKDSEGNVVKNHISIVKFAGKMQQTPNQYKVGNDTYKEYGNTYNYSQIVTDMTDVSTGSAALKAAVNGLKAGGATSADYGMQLASYVLSQHKDNPVRRSVVIMFTDGEPNHSSDFDKDVAKDAIAAAKGLKDKNTVVFTIGIFNGAYPNASVTSNNTSDTNKYMHAVSSNYPGAAYIKTEDFWSTSWDWSFGERAKDSNYYLAASNAADLEDIFVEISNEVNTLAVKVDATSVLSDTLSGAFDFNAPENAEYSGITVAKYPVTGMENGVYTWGAAQELAIGEGEGKVQVEVSGKKLEVTGFDYGANAVTTKTEGGSTAYSGYKLVVTIPIKPDTEYHGWADGANYYDTNSTANGSKAGLEYGETGSRQKLELNESPNAPVTGYTVSYEFKGTAPDGVTKPDDKVYIEGQNYTIETAPSKEGWTFKGWCSDEACTAIVSGQKPMGTEPVTYYGKWEQKQPGVLVTKRATYTRNGKDMGSLPFDTGDKDKMGTVQVGDVINYTVTITNTGTTTFGNADYALDSFTSPSGNPLLEHTSGTSQIVSGGNNGQIRLAGLEPTKYVTKYYRYVVTENDATGTKRIANNVWAYVHIDPTNPNSDRLPNRYSAVNVNVVKPEPTTATLSFEFVNGTDNTTLPEDITKQCPAERLVEKNTSVTLETVFDAVEDNNSTWTFVGWYTDADCTEAAAAPYVMPNTDTTLYGKWTKEEQQPETTTITVKKEWRGLADGATKPEVEMTLWQSTDPDFKVLIENAGTLTLNGSTETTPWTGVFENVRLKNDEDEPLYYFVSETEIGGIDVPFTRTESVDVTRENEDGSITVIGTWHISREKNPATNTWTITNRYEDKTPAPVEKISITVEKRWDKNNSESVVKPNEISVQLTQNGVNYGEPVELSAANNWTYTFTELLETDDNGEAYNYSVKEPDLDARDGNGDVIGTWKPLIVQTDTTITITNTFVAKEPEPELEDHEFTAHIVKRFENKSGKSPKATFTFVAALDDGTNVGRATISFSKGEVDAGDFERKDETMTVKLTDSQYEALEKDRIGRYLWIYEEDGEVDGVKYDTEPKKAYIYEKPVAWSLEFDEDGELVFSVPDENTLYCLVGDEMVEDFVFTNTYKKPGEKGETIKSGPQLNRDDHVAYIMGYPDGTVQPKGEITRAEACTIFFRLLTDSSRDYYFSKTNDYTDVNAGDWFNNAISTLSNAGIVTGYNDGTFRPNQPITRGEMAKIIANFANLNKGTKSFTDLSGHWSKTYVELAAGNGWIAGYPDGSFRPDQKITRAETVTMINRVLERVPAKELRLLSRSIMLTFPDNNPGDWYYIAIQEASNSHEYQRSVYETTGDEMWTKLIDNVDWTKLEK